MQDVISARDAGEDVEERLNTIQNEIQIILNSNMNNEIDWSSIKKDIYDAEFTILSGDWGGYYEAYRRPLILYHPMCSEMLCVKKTIEFMSNRTK